MKVDPIKKMKHVNTTCWCCKNDSQVRFDEHRGEIFCAKCGVWNVCFLMKYSKLNIHRYNIQKHFYKQLFKDYFNDNIKEFEDLGMELTMGWVKDK